MGVVAPARRGFVLDLKKSWLLHYTRSRILVGSSVVSSSLSCLSLCLLMAIPTDFEIPPRRSCWSWLEMAEDALLDIAPSGRFFSLTCSIGGQVSNYYLTNIHCSFVLIVSKSSGRLLCQMERSVISFCLADCFP